MKAIILLFILLQLSLTDPIQNSKLFPLTNVVDKNPPYYPKNLRNSTLVVYVNDYFKKRFPNTSQFFTDTFVTIVEVGKSVFTEVKNDAAIINSRVMSLSSKIIDNTKFKLQELIKNIKDKIINNQ